MQKEEIKTLADLFDYACGLDLPGLFVFREGREIVSKSSPEFRSDVFGAAAELERSGCRGRFAAVTGENSYEYIVSVFALVLSGNVPVLIDKAMDASKVAAVCRGADCTWILYSEEYRDKAETSGIPGTCFRNMIGQPAADFKGGARPGESDTALVFLTSGSTGLPKMVPLSHRNIIAELEAIQALLVPESGQEDRVAISGATIICLPLHHVFGMVSHLMYSLYSGLEIFINRSLRELVADIRTARPFALVCVPAIYSMLVSRLPKGAQLRDLLGDNLKLIIMGGAALTIDPGIFLENGIRIVGGYGLTETASTVAGFYLRRGETGNGLIGPAVKGASLRIAENGEILVKGDMVFGGYMNNEKVNAEAFSDGYFRTGDMGYLDEQGRLYITGRLKNLIVLPNGENVPAESLESLIEELPLVEECVVTEHDGKITAFVYGSDKAGLASGFKAGLSRVNGSLPITHNITDYKLLEEPFPRLSNGKIDRKRFLDETGRV